MPKGIAVDSRGRIKDRPAMTDTTLLLTITVAVFFVLYLAAILFLGGGFAKPQNFLNILNNNASLIVLSCGMSIVMITGGIDISVGAVTCLVCMTSAVNLEQQGGSILTVILIGLGIGLAFGAVQGFLVAHLGIQPFIVSLAGMFFAKGMTTIVSKEPVRVTDEGFLAVKDTRIIVPGLGSNNKLGEYIPAYVEVGVVTALAVVVLLFCLPRWTRLGRSFYAVGTFFGVLSLNTIKRIVSSLGFDEAWWSNITVAAMLCLFLVIQSVVLLRKNKK